jgi:hypothetical protein
MKKEKFRKILAIRDYNLKKEDEFPKNPNNITKDELHDHFDLDDDGKVTLDEYADHINFHCDNPEILDEELENAEYEKGFKYKKGGKTKKAKTWKEKYNKKYGNELDASNSLSDIAEDTGVSKKGIQQIYNKGIGAYKTNPSSVRPNVKSKEQWAQARVYSAVMGGKASKVDKKELSMEKGGIMDSRRDKDKEFDRAQEREYMRSQYDSLTQDDKEKLKMIQKMMAKEKVNYAKGGAIKGRNNKTGESFGVVIGSKEFTDDDKDRIQLNVRSSYGSRISEYKLVFDKKGNLQEITDYGYSLDGYPSTSSGSGKKISAQSKSESVNALKELNFPQSFSKRVIEFVSEKSYAKGGEVKKSEKYGSEYKKEDGQLLFRPINTKEDWSEVSDEAFNKEERKDFDKEMNRIFKKGGKTDTKISNLVTVGAIEKPLKDLEKIGKLKLEYLYNQLKISKNLLDNSIGKDDRIMNTVRYDSIQKLIDNILIK